VPGWQRAGYPVPVTTGLDFAEYATTETIGPVSGVYATSLGIGGSFTAGFSAMSRGEVPEMTNLLGEARHVALIRAVQHAQALGGNGVVGIRFDSNEVGSGILEIHCYGTAVVLGARPS
jgi:uncharacterized protein YbjQ (UPF0145 family)